MLYSGHFSFDETSLNNEQRHGYLTCLVEAENPVSALKKFKERIYHIKASNEETLFNNIAAIYVEDIVEISEPPENPVILRYQSSEGRFPKTKSCFMPISENEKIKSYQWQPAWEEKKDIDGYTEAVPFLQFRSETEI